MGVSWHDDYDEIEKRSARSATFGTFLCVTALGVAVALVIVLFALG